MYPNRLREELTELGTFGRTPAVRVESYNDLVRARGLSRPSGTEADKKARDYVVSLMEKAGLGVKIDKVGNVFARKSGRTEKGVVMTGSHLDSVIDGGMFDGTLGVMSALEAVRRIIEEGFENYRPIEVAVYTAEEGSAFSPALLGSSVLTGKMSVDEALGLRNGEGETLEECLERIGYKGDFEKTLEDVEYALELHIEQGPYLEREGFQVGIVENITGIGWIMATIEGQESHAGTTPMKMRKDALVGAADVITFVNRRAKAMVDELGACTVATVGKLKVFPGGTNVIPGRTEMGIDIRDVARENMEKLMNETLHVLKDLEKRYSLKVSTEVPITHMPVALSKEVVRAFEICCQQMGVRATRMNSGAGHDSQNLAERVKAGMIFVPSVGGISHAPTEWTEWSDVETGTEVLTQTLKNLSTKQLP